MTCRFALFMQVAQSSGSQVEGDQDQAEDEGEGCNHRHADDSLPEAGTLNVEPRQVPPVQHRNPR